MKCSRWVALTLVDWEGDGEQRGYVVRYTAEQIRNWQVSRINGRNLVTLVVLHEIAAETTAKMVST